MASSSEATTRPSRREDESADPVGDGHADADFARHAGAGKPAAEEADAPSAINPDTLRIGRQAARDLARGLVDTDRGPVMERLYSRHYASRSRRRPQGRRG